MKNYNPNIWEGTHIVKITIQQWEYKGHIWAEIGGNCKGGDIVFGFQDYFECEEGDFGARNDCNLKEEDGWWTGTLKDNEGNELEFEKTSRDMDKMIVAVEIESYEGE